MDPGTVVVELFKTGVWPVSLLVGLGLLRTPIGRVVQRLRSLTFKSGTHEFDVRIDSATLEDAARVALPQVAVHEHLPAPPHPANHQLPSPPEEDRTGLTVDELTVIALAAELTRDAVYVADEGGDSVWLMLRDGTRVPVSRASLEAGYPRTSEIVEAVLRHRNPKMGAFTLAIVKAQVERANAHWDQVKDLPHMPSMDQLMGMEESDIHDAH